MYKQKEFSELSLDEKAEFLLDLQKETNKSIEELNKQLTKQVAETNKQIAETNKQLAKTDKEISEVNKQIAKTDKKFNKIGNFIDNDGRVVEEYFYTALNRSKVLHHEHFDLVSHGVKDRFGKDFDIILFNSNKTICIEVKKIVHINDVNRFLEKGLPAFKEFLSDSITYCKHKIYGGMAGYVINDDAEKLARENGFILLKKQGKEVNEITENDEIKAIF